MSEDELKAENARLKAEVGELCEAIKLASEVGIKIADEVTRLKAEVERLRKAGDVMAEVLDDIAKQQGLFGFMSVHAWNAAKEGKPSEQKSPSFIEDLGNGVEKHDLLFRYPAKEGKPSV